MTMIFSWSPVHAAFYSTVNIFFGQELANQISNVTLS